MNDFVYSIDEENFNLDGVGEVIDAMDNPEIGMVYYRGIKVKRKPSDYFNIERVFEDMAESAYDEAGEWADDFPDLSKEEKNELNSVISDWLDSKLSVSFFTVKNVEKIELTELDLG